MQKPGILHWDALQRVLRYLKGTINYGLVYRHGRMNNNIQVYCDADWLEIEQVINLQWDM